MAHYAFLDSNNIVTEVIVGRDEGELGIDWEQYYGEFRGQVCRRTSYRTRGGVHEAGGVPFRKNYAGQGYKYDVERDAFIPPQPWTSWLLDEGSCLWVAPVSYPNDGLLYRWDEESVSWVQVEQDPITMMPGISDDGGQSVGSESTSTVVPGPV